ncbi:EAL domain-containing protein [Pseudomaricurvus alkylphenolicus]|uniref:EAL domain-containing protein n=1 Tax=Pseudomaricurvus alkylphenolicus TaxID=1306991 RepID=UPI00142451F5|nr:EAL domain-containing protein [Pseudomaricurvus alkylphenolicus]NIB39036.1 EAL domain-containing protein [Pseudomaricurvus alkylphenolicus]
MPVEAADNISLPLSADESERFLGAITDAYFLVDPLGVIRRVNGAAQLLLDAGEDQLIGYAITRFVSIPRPFAKLQVGDSLAFRSEAAAAISLRLALILPAEEGCQHWLVVPEDREQRFRQQLLRQRSMTQMTLCSVADAVISVDSSGCIETINPMARELLQLTDHSGVGMPVDQLFPLSDPTTLQPLEPIVSAALKRGKPIQTQSVLLCVGDNDPITIGAQVVPLRNHVNQMDGALLVFRDVSQASREAHRLNWQARHDALTGLPNRQTFEEEVSQALEAAQRHRETYGLLYIDLYQFKVVNDSCGHAAGDELLKQVADLMSAKLRSQDLLARLGSDEFGVLLKNCTIAGAQRVADGLLRAVSQYQFVWDSREIKVAISVGAVVIDAEVESEGQILATANAACCTAKELGRNRIHIYNRDREVEQRRREINWVVEINEALSQQRMVLYRQPIVAIDGTGDKHYEVLIRMLDRDNQIVGPANFVPAAEHYGVVDELDRWVVDQVINYLGRRHRWDLPVEKYSVNLSGSTLSDPRFTEFVVSAIARAGIDPSQLHFEITETVAIKHLDAALQFMHTLKELGSSFYLDDFGSGLSSFGYLKDLPVDYLKIDGAFVGEMLDDSTSFAMVSTINHLAHVMGLRTVAEFVENDELKDHLADMGVDYVQGYGVARPEPMDLLLEY